MDHGALSNQHSAIGQNQDQKQNQPQHQNQKPFTAKDAKGAENTHPKEPNPGPLGAPDMEKERVRRRAEALLRRIGETCDELDRLAEENPELVGRVTRAAEEHKDAYVRLKARLELADEAPRCRWVKQDGTACGSPQMKKHIYCFAHRQMMEARALALSLPAPEDANAIQIGIMRIQKALIEGTISTKMAGLLLYSMQLALQNVGQVTFGQAKTQELVRTTVDEEAALSTERSAISENQNPNQRPFTAEGAEDAKEKEIGLPQMDADERGLEPPRPVEWRPSADMYRMDTREGREAYEASLRAVPHEDRQMHANLG